MTPVVAYGFVLSDDPVINRRQGARVCEPAKPSDEWAVRVDWHGRKFGSVPRMVNTTIAQMLDRCARLTAQSAASRKPRSVGMCEIRGGDRCISKT